MIKSPFNIKNRPFQTFYHILKPSIKNKDGFSNGNQFWLYSCKYKWRGQHFI